MRSDHIKARFDEVFTLQMGKTPDRKNPSLFEGNNLKQTANFNLNDSDEVNEGNEEEDEEEEEDKKTNYDKKFPKYILENLLVHLCLIRDKSL